MDSEVLALKWNNHQSIFYQIICGLRTKGSYTDVTLACEGKFYPVHKLVLSTCSEYFSEIFDRTPCKNPVVVLKDIQCRDLEFLLDYMYIGEVNVRQHELSSLIKAAECLKVKGLAVQEDEPKHASSGAKQRVDHARVNQYSPLPKRLRADERKSSTTSSVDNASERYITDLRWNENSHSSDTSVPALPSEHTEKSLGQHQDEQEQSRDMVSEQGVALPLTGIKVEQDLVYDGNYDSTRVSAPSSYDGDQYLQEGEARSPKAEPEGAAPILDDSVMGVNFNKLLQSSLTSDDSIDPHSAIHPNAAVAALGLLQSASNDPQSSLRLLQHQQGSTAELYGQQQNVAVSEGGGLPDYLMKKEKLARDYVCQFCGREFGHRTNLQAHLRIHTGEKPFRCLYCPYRTALKGNLKMHTISRHKIDWKSIKHLVHPVENST